MHNLSRVFVTFFYHWHWLVCAKADAVAICGTTGLTICRNATLWLQKVIHVMVFSVRAPSIASVSMEFTAPVLESSWNVMAHGDAREGKWRGNWRMEWVASTPHTTSEHGVSIFTTADAHASAASSRLNWRPDRFKWTSPFRLKTKSGFCACAITFQTQSNGRKKRTIEAVRSSETLVRYRITRCHDPQGHSIDIHLSESLKSYEVHRQGQDVTLRFCDLWWAFAVWNVQVPNWVLDSGVMTKSYV
jgi:hypothetical protein